MNFTNQIFNLTVRSLTCVLGLAYCVAIIGAYVGVYTLGTWCFISKTGFQRLGRIYVKLD